MPTTHTVTIHDDSFDPQSVTVQVQDTVVWINQDPENHTTTSDSGVWNSGVLSTGQSFPFTFGTAGTFPYHCEIHRFMTGTVVVTS
ncbi:plastocyanin [Streptomyces griseocarneus]|nr:plastocyanin [Streptomyces griseocarneus]